MSAMILDGKAVAQEIYEDLAAECQRLTGLGVQPALSVVLVGEDPASKIYVRNKARACKQCGMRSVIRRLPETASQEELTRTIDELNADQQVHGILVQLPLPGHLDADAALRRIDAKKDVDGIHPYSAGSLLLGHPGMLPCTPAGCLELIRRSGAQLEGARAVVIGRSNTVGKPMALLLLQNNCTVTICHSRTRNLAAIAREADILVAAIGRPRFVTADMIKPGAVVIDVGINRLPDGHLAGDVDFDGASDVAGAITPVPGGVGPMTVAMLMKNTCLAAAAYV